MTVATKKRPPEVILKSLVARASCAVLGFRIPHMFSLLKLDNVAKIFEVIFACPHLPWSGLHATRNPLGVFQKVTFFFNLTQRKDTERKFNIPEV